MLTVKNLKISFRIGGVFTPVAQDISYQLAQGGTLGIVGESGCGKSVSSHALAGLLDPKQARVHADVLEFNGKNLLRMTETKWRNIRGNEISLIFQNPMTSLNPLMKCGKQIGEAITMHQTVSKTEAKKRSIGLLRDMGIPGPQSCYGNYPHQLSGGMRQRVMIAMALACRPKLLIADEPTTALDATIQMQILELVSSLQKKIGMALILITHDLGIVQDMVDNLMVMYAGQVVEKGPTRKVLVQPRHPYTFGLIRSIPDLKKASPRLHSIEGTVPAPDKYPQGCRFYPRCRMGESSCRQLAYRLQGNAEHQSACQFWDKV